MERFELTLSKEYLKNWGVQESLREIIQNAIDIENEGLSKGKDNKMSVQYDEKSSTLIISNENTFLSKKSLLLGYTTKTDNPNSIGKFGEGYKMALLALNRLNKPVFIHNNLKNETWSTSLVKSTKFDGEEVLNIFITETSNWGAEYNSNKLSFEIKGISTKEYNTFKERVLQLQSNVNAKPIKDMGSILLDKKYKGKIFVGGLYVTTIEELTYGYDIAPKYLKIGRDRDVLSDLQISEVTSTMWSLNESDTLFELISKGAFDVRFIKFSLADSNDIDKDAIYNKVYNNFKARYGKNSAPASTQSDVETLNSSYLNIEAIKVSCVEKDLIVQSKLYQEFLNSLEVNKSCSIHDLYKNWKEKCSFLLDEADLMELDHIISLAK